jgi:hypothetical protein
MFKIYEFKGQGGKHRNTADALAWRTATTQAAETIRAAAPEMQPVVVMHYAEMEVGRAFRAANRAQQNRTLGIQ